MQDWTSTTLSTWNYWTLHTTNALHKTGWWLIPRNVLFKELISRGSAKTIVLLLHVVQNILCVSITFISKGKKKNAGTVQLLYNTTSVLTNSATCGRNSKQIMWNITRAADNAREMRIVTGMFCQEIKFSHLGDSFWTWSIIKVPIHTNNCCIWSTTKCSKCKNKWPRQETCLASGICSISSIQTVRREQRTMDPHSTAADSQLVPALSESIVLCSFRAVWIRWC